MQWDLLNSKTVLKTPPFNVEELDLKDRRQSGPDRPYYRLDCPNWVNVLAITKENEVVLIKQSRAGSFKVELEIPGGIVEKDEADTSLTAKRELEEETGYTCNELTHLGTMNPNAAIMRNHLSMYLAKDCYLAEPRKHFPDRGESIEVVCTPIHQLSELIKNGDINNCLVALTIALAQSHIEELTI